MAIIKIRDNATGIPADQLKMVLEPFYTTKQTGKGNIGLGLSISYDIMVKEHGGDLHLESEAGEFTEVSLILPLSTEKAPSGISAEA